MPSTGRMLRRLLLLAALLPLTGLQTADLSRGDRVSLRAAAKGLEAASSVIQRRACDLDLEWADIRVTVVTSNGSGGVGASLYIACFDGKPVVTRR